MSKKSVILTIVAALASCTAFAESTRTLRATLSADAIDRFAVENLAGTMSVVAADVNAVEAVVTVHAESDALASTISVVQVRGREGRPTLLVRYPVDEHRTYRYPGHGSSNCDYDDRRVKVSSSSGVLLWADVEVRVPRHLEDAAFYNRVGALHADGLDGRIRLDTGSADIVARNVSGKVVADTGSGDVHGESLGGSFSCDTGSGDCVVTGFQGDDLSCDTGSGDVTVRGAHGATIKADTGSGSVKVEDSDVEEFRGDTGSGDISVQIAGARLRRVVADTGSGDVTLMLPPDASFALAADVGSGDIVSRFSDAQPVLDHRTVVGYRRGDGRIRMDVDTGSGDVTVAPR